MRFFKSYNLLLQIIVVLCGAEVVTSCLQCLTTPADRTSICKHAVSLGKMEAEECLQRLNLGFEPLNNTSIAFSQINNFRKYLKMFDKELKKINESYLPPAWVEQFDIKMAQYVEDVKKRAASHPPAECRPPCGLQKAARSFSCGSCTEEDCKIPVACPIENINVTELDKTVLSCGASLTLPEYPKVIWKYAKNIRKTDLGYFKDIYSGEDLFVIIQPTRVIHAGTYACEIFDDDDDIIIRKFYYLHVTRPKDSGQIELEFQRAIMEKLPSQEEEEERILHGPSTSETILSYLQSPISYAIYAAVCFLGITLLVGFLARYALDVDQKTRKKYSPLSSPPYP